MVNKHREKVRSDGVPYNIRYIDYTVLKDSRVTPSIARFVRAGICMRATILAFLLNATDHLKLGMKVIDIGAGDSPYRDLFKQQDYTTSDFARTDYHKYQSIDYICPAHEVPVESGSFDAIVCTEVLEHVPNPVETMKEFNRILKENGQLFITTPFIISIHEPPYDFLRYTPFYFEKLLKESGFKVIFISPRGGTFAAITHLLIKMRPRPPKGLRNLLIYFFLFMPLVFLPVLILKQILIKLAFIMDRALDQDEVFPPGYAVYAVKNQDMI